MVNQIPIRTRVQLNKAKSSDTKAPFLESHLAISDGFVSYKIYYLNITKRGDFNFGIVNFPFLDGDIPRAVSYGVYMFQLIRFARVSCHVFDFKTRNKILTAKLLNQDYRYHKLRRAFSKAIKRITSWYQNLIWDSNLFLGKACRYLNFMVN